MQQNYPFASNLCLSEVFNGEQSGESISQESYRKNHYSAAMLGLIISMGTTGMLMMSHQKETLAAVDSVVIERSLSGSKKTVFLAQNLPASINLKPVSLTQTFSIKNIVELPQLRPLTPRLEKTELPSSELSSPSINPETDNNLQQQQLIALNNLKEKQQQLSVSLGKLKAKQMNSNVANNFSTSERLAESSSNDTSGFFDNAEIQPKKTIHIFSNLEKSSHSIPQLPSLTKAESPVEKKLTKQIYTVKSGDTIAEIASRYGISSAQLIQTNQLNNPDLLLVNQQLTIPKPAKTNQTNSKFNLQTPASPNLSSASLAVSSVTPANTFNDTAEESSFKQNDLPLSQDPYIAKLRADLIQLREQYQTQVGKNSSNNSNSSSPLLKNETNIISTAPARVENYNQNVIIQIGTTVNPELPPLSSPDQYLPDSPTPFNGYIWPATGTLTSGYGWRWGRMHRGIDIAAPVGTPIMAAASGEVISAGWNSGGYGNLVKLKHPDGSVTLYAHNNKIVVSRGQKVEQGQLIAEMGSTGYSTGPHLHFEIRPNGETTVNPIAYLPTK
jgi:murein DD-endopeptidase MepM/ murein hydrolase activator NlpD